MRIGIVAPANPYELRDLINYEGTKLPDINKGTPIINAFIREYIQQGHEVIAFSFSNGINSEFYFKGEHLKIYVVNSVHRFLPTVFFRLYAPKLLKKAISKEIENLDILHAHWTYENALAASKFTKYVPVFCSVRDWCPKILRMQTKFKELVYWCFSWIVFKKVMSSSINYFIANSDYTRTQVLLSYPNCKASVIPNAISQTYMKKNNYVPLKQRGKIFISISQEFDSYWKNYSKLIDAFSLVRKDYPDSRLLLIGRGDINTSKVLKDKHNHGKMEGVELLGFLNRQQLFDVLDSSVCLVHPSLEETFGNTLIEAMARGVYVIGGSQSGAVPQVLGYGEFGTLCDVKSAQNIASAMTNVIKNIDNVQEVAKKAMQNVSVQYNIQNTIGSHIKLYNDAIKEYSSTK